MCYTAREQDDWCRVKGRQSRCPRIRTVYTSPYKARCRLHIQKANAHLEQRLDDLPRGDAVALRPGGAGNHHLQHGALGVEHSLVDGPLVLAEAPRDRELYISHSREGHRGV
jgi:hypothetical protein